MRGSNGANGVRYLREKKSATLAETQLVGSSTSSKQPPAIPSISSLNPGNFTLNALLDLPNASELLSNIISKQPIATVPTNKFNQTTSSSSGATGGIDAIDLPASLDINDDEEDDDDMPTVPHDSDKITTGSYYSSKGSMSGGALGMAGSSTGNKQVMVAGSQFRIATKPSTCESCGVYDQKLKKYKEIVRSLKLQVARLQDQVAGMRKGRSGAESIQGMGDNADRVHGLLKQCDEHELELSRLRKLSAADQKLIDTLREGSIRLAMDNKQLGEAAAAVREEGRSQATANRELQRELEALRMEQLQCQTNFEHCKSKLESMLARDKLVGGKSLADGAEIERLRKLLATAETDLQNEKATNEALLGDLKTLESELKHQGVRYETLEHDSRREQKETALKLLTAEALVATHCGTIGELLEQREEREMHVAKLEVLNQQQSAEIERLRALLARAEQVQSDTDEELSKQKSAIQRAISSSVRLCIVAPSVNVHVADKQMRFKSSLAEKQLSTFLTTEVLSKYSFLFKQKEDAGGGEPCMEGTSEGWIQKMLLEMQKSIESHVNSAMDGGDK